MAFALQDRTGSPRPPITVPAGKRLWPAIVRSGLAWALAALLIGAMPAGALWAAETVGNHTGGQVSGQVVGPRSGLPLPRYASIGARVANLRAGPGVRYPVEWVYRRRGLPIRIIAEFDVWRQVEDWRGTTGWFHRSMLSGRRMAIATRPETILRREAGRTAVPVAEAEAGAILHVLKCAAGWCRVEANGLTGWTPQSGLWGILPGETVD